MELKIQTRLQHQLSMDDDAVQALVESVTFTMGHKPGAAERLRPIKEVLDRFIMQMRDYEPLLGGLAASSDPSDLPQIPQREQLTDNTSEEQPAEPPAEETPPTPETAPPPPPPPPFEIEPPPLEGEDPNGT